MERQEQEQLLWLALVVCGGGGVGRRQCQVPGPILLRWVSRREEHCWLQHDPGNSVIVPMSSGKADCQKVANVAEMIF